MRRALALAVTATVLLGGAHAASADARGGRPRANAVTPQGWRVTPAGREIGVSRLAIGFQGPLGADLSPDGSRLLAASSGSARIESADLFDLRRRRRTDYQPYDAYTGLRPDGRAAAPAESAFYGVAYAPDGRRAWVSGGGQQVVHELAVNGNSLDEVREIPVPGFAAGIAYARTPVGPRLYVALNTVPSGVSGDAPSFSATPANAPGHQVASVDPATGAVKPIELGRALQPLGVAFSRDGARAFVTNWMGRSVSVIDTRTEMKATDVTLSRDPLAADHPSAIEANPVRNQVYTANANSDTVSVLDSRTGAVKRTIPVGLVANAPKGANPQGLAVTPDGRTLYVALAGENAVAVVDLDRRSVRGFIPTAWYPADVDVTPDGRRLVVTNTNDSGAGPNPCGPLTPRRDCPPKDPNRDAPDRESIDPQFSTSMIKGSVQVVRVSRSAGTLAGLTAQVFRNNQVRAREQSRPRAAAAIRHVIYVVKENRTYDQVFGDLPAGNGDASLALFKDDSAPNQRTLARRFGLYDNFYADAEVSADGHNWITQANASDYVDKTYPVNYSPGNRSLQRGYDFEDVPLGQQFPTEPLPDRSDIRPAAAQTVGYIWDNAFRRGRTYRSYGEYARFLGFLPTCPKSGNDTSTTHLKGNIDLNYPGYSTRCSDTFDRFPEWKREFDAYEARGNLPALSIVRLPNDHTEGTRAGSATPQAYVADNDLALGKMVQELSHSRYWRDTVMLVTEDDAQDGPDHVDAHRTLALVISAYSGRTADRRHGRRRIPVDSTHYDTASMIATAEDLLGMPPMSIMDQRAARMWGLFRDKPDLTPYTAATPAVRPFNGTATGFDVNPPTAPMARQAATWDLTREDRAPEIALNEAIWQSVRGRHARMPAPRHTRILGVRSRGD